MKASQSTKAKATLTLDERIEAVCRQVDPELFFPGQGEDDRAAKAVCMGCPLRADHLGGDGRCLDVAIANNEADGVWGGLSTPERKRLVAERKKEANAA